MSWRICRKDISKRISVMNMNANKIRPANCNKFLGLLSPRLGTPAKSDLPSTRDSANTSRSAPINARFLNRNCMSHSMLYAIVCRITMKNKTPQAMLTRHLLITMTHPPSCPIRFTRTKTVARNFPQPHDASIYSRCSLHWNHIRKPSSRKVAMRHNRANVGSTCLPLRITCHNNKYS